jgi:hypothetical protein
VRSFGRSRPADSSDNDDGEGEKDTQGGKKGTGNRKGKARGWGWGDDISRAVALQLQKETYEPDSDTEGQLVRGYIEPPAMPAVSIISSDETDSSGSEGE